MREFWSRLRRFPRNLLSIGVDISRLDQKLDGIRLSLADLSRLDKELDSIRLSLDDVHAHLVHAASGRAADREQLDAVGSMLTTHSVTISEKIEKLRAIIAGEDEEYSSVEINRKPDRRVFLEKISALFLVGHARSGTTVLNDALNMSPDIWMFGEANFHYSGERRDFQSWYNEMHQHLFGNPFTKTTHCPKLLDRGATGEDYLAKLSNYYRFVGDGVAFRDETLGYSFDRFMEYQQRYFFGAHYICLLRSPRATLSSAIKMWPDDDVALYVRSYLRTLLLCVDISRIFPNCKIVIHENITERTFEVLSEYLNADLSNSFHLYSKDRQKKTGDSWSETGLSLEHQRLLDEAWQRLFTYYDVENLSLRNDRDTLQGWQQELRETLRKLGAGLVSSN
ncbi:Sulfotransferase family protein [Bosea lupini]|uniref:Sulfotransferase family protein n=1 Tax=Bosea lupini TaxID=1036779 RepID=A0A1H7PWX8_9HYPH|nr:sulfotransferase [Bosea lupini]SEL40109.1 Sulfotransferase family protein [Bosea lupini]